MPCLTLLAGLICLQANAARGAPPSTVPPAGLRENLPSTTAIVGARVVVAPGVTLENATLVLRDGLIESVGTGITVPADAVTRSGFGKTIYAGFIDAYGESPVPPRGANPNQGAGYWNPRVTPQTSIADEYQADLDFNRRLRSQGIVARLVAPSRGIIKGRSALVATGESASEKAILKANAALHLLLTAARDEGTREYPNSPMGAFTLVRQAFYDARWRRDAWRAFEAAPNLPRPERNDALAALEPWLAGGAPVVIDAADEWYFLRADRVGREFELNVIVRGSGREYRRLAAIQATGRPVILPLQFPIAPDVGALDAARGVPLERLMQWDLAPENAARLDAAGVKIAFTSHGLGDVGAFLSAIRKVVDRGLPPAQALKALSQTPAELYGVADRMGTVEAGKLANLVVTDGDLFDPKTKILETWVEGSRYAIEATPLTDLRGTWELSLHKPDGGTEALKIEIAGEPLALNGSVTRGDRKADLEKLKLDGARLTTQVKGEPLGWSGVLRLSVGLEFDPSAPTTPAEGAAPVPSWRGKLAWADGAISLAHGKRLAPFAPAAAPANPVAEPRRALYEPNFPLGAFGRSQLPDQPAAMAIRRATVWTSGPQGNLESGTVIVQAGKITYVGSDSAIPAGALPAGALEIDAAGKHVSPGIIDCHSHIATDGGVNESGQTITAEVRIGDFIDSNDIAIYRQLAGGVTSANILHGSANTIGGQNQVIKFRWGQLPEEMKFAGAPDGIKFALGENVKQSNWGDQFTTRYPQTRMGVEQLVRDAFRAAGDYRRHWDAFRASPVGIPPRVDLELEALSEVLAGTRRIHCHSYRQDEILSFLRTCEEFHVKVGTLQHILEGYKVADVMARHGVGGSSFSDWWAYKFEVFDAIPYNGALMHGAGVVVSFNSDDAELARRLNTEAAKAMKYGDVPPTEALKFVTLNPAIQLGIEGSVGSLEVGKDADLVLWSASPLSSYAVCEQTWIDGRKYFDRDSDRESRGHATAMREALVQRVLSSGEPTGPDDDTRPAWPREDLFCHHGHDEAEDHEHRENALEANEQEEAR